MSNSSLIIQPGRLKHTLYLQETSKVRGNPGNWTNVTNGKVRCSKLYLSGSEPTSASGTRGQNLLELEMRYRSDVTYDKRFSSVSNGRGVVYDIISIINVEDADHKLILRVQERTRDNG